MRTSLVCVLLGMAVQASGCVAPQDADMGSKVDTSGGEVKFSDPLNPTLDGAGVVIPPGALDKSVTIQIVPCDDLSRTGESAAGPCARFLPEDVTFKAPVTLRIPYLANQVLQSADLNVKNVHNTIPSWTTLAGGLSPDPATGLISLQVTNLGDYEAVNVERPLPPLTKNIDILFLIDNSPSMVGKQKALAANIGALITQLDAAGADYHIGIATSDIGSDTAPGKPWGGNIGKCDTFEGDDGVLQAIPCDQRPDVSSDAKNACSSLCPDDRFVPNDGTRFISKVDGKTNVPVAMELDPRSGKMVDRGPVHAFQCIGLVGDSGCGIESQLEGAKRALDNHRSENAGFLRANSVLAVIYLTDEDDCSVQLARRNENNPITRDCDPAQPDNYDCYNVDFRCLARSIQCNETMLAPGVKTGCRERADNYLVSVDKYYKFLSALRPGSRLVVGGIWTQPSISGGGHVEIARGSGGSTTPFLNRAPGRGASCTYEGDATIFGQAQNRLSSYAKLFGTSKEGKPNAIETSVCDINNYGTALDKIGQAVASLIAH